ncbi:spermidine/putrescine ABC transporter permease [Streptococcus pneumoniae]|nr:spermidine/putrescine ABC transporter permease [Streptococcus pneumoniae]VNF79681.1 spermidine/putrescine ABC transporter permease [Streptococcus pneumoniae]VRT50640.1 spermidine/putrescine ABC transporter permease [Streptococcus pneumoniae]VTZ37869.1 spermidine/putrescine ABC transporter permease [Streptococcus pneumoniae]
MKKFANLYLGLVFLVLYLPIFYLIGYAFNAGDDMNSFTGFSWTHFETMFGDGRLMLILAQTFFLAFLSALIATIIGTFGAIYIYQSRKKYQEAFLSLNNILMVAPDVMIGASFLILFTQLKFSLGFSTLSVEIYSRARKGISLEINALSALVFLFSIILVVGYYFISREKEEQA